MSSPGDENLRRFSAAVYGDVEDKVNEILMEAENEKKSILDEAARESEESAEKFYNNNIKKHANKYVSDITKAELGMKKDILKHKEELTNKVFEVIQKRIEDYRSTPEYVQTLMKTLNSANAPNGSDVYISLCDMKYADTLKKASGMSDTVFIPDENIKLGGLSVYNKDRGVISDKTFDRILDEQKRLFASSNAFYSSAEAS